MKFRKSSSLSFLVAICFLATQLSFASAPALAAKAGWTPQSLTGGFQAIATNGDGAKVFALKASDPKVYVSTNSGASWVSYAITTAKPNWAAITSSRNGKKLAAVTSSSLGQIFTSVDSGKTWKSHPSVASNYWTSIASSADGTKLVATSRKDLFGTGFIYVSSDSGNKWKRVFSPADASWKSIGSSSDGLRLAAVADGDPHVYTSENSGLTWASSLITTGSPTWGSITSSDDGANLAVSSRTGALSIFTSNDYGSSWVARTSAGRADWYSVVSNSDGTKLVASQYGLDRNLGPGYVFLSQDSGATWKKQTDAGLARWGALASNSDGRKIVAAPVLSDQRVAGHIWSYLVPPPPKITSVSPATSNINGGTTIQVTGSGFVAGASVIVGGSSCNNVVVKSDSLLSCVAPPNPAGPADLVVTNLDTLTDRAGAALKYTRPIVSASKVSINDTVTGSTSPVQVETITNNGDEALVFGSRAVSVTGPNRIDFTVVSDNCSNLRIGVAESCSVSFTFTPGDVGPRTANLVFDCKATGTPNIVVLQATGLGLPEFSASTPLVVNTYAGSTSPAQVETITNTGNADLGFGPGSVRITGANAGDFTIVSDSCSSRVLAPGKTCTVGYTFSPVSLDKRTANLVFISNAPDSPNSISIEGNGVGFAVFSASPPAVLNTYLGSTSPSQITTITNIGSANMVFGPGSVTLSGPNSDDFTILSDKCSNHSLVPRATCTVSYNFTPSDIDVRRATLTFSSNTLDGQDSVELEGTGFGLGVFSASTASIAVTETGSSSALQTETVTNNGNGDLVFGASAVTVNGSNRSEFVIVTDSCSSRSIAPGGMCTVTYVFRPLGVGSRTASLDFVTSPDNVVHSVALQASAVGFNAIVSPIPNTYVGSLSPLETVTITNSASRTITLAANAVTKSGANQGDFSLISDNCSNRSLMTAKSCSVTFKFKPSAAGIRTARLLFASDGATSPNSVDLSAVGMTVVTIKKLSVTSGAKKGGVTVEITGTGFNTGSTVSFGGATAVVTKRTGSTGLTVKTPAHGVGAVSVVVTNLDGGTTTYKSFTYTK